VKKGEGDRVGRGLPKVVNFVLILSMQGSFLREWWGGEVFCVMVASTNIFQKINIFSILFSYPFSSLFGYVDLHFSNSPFKILKASITIIPAMMALVVAMAGIICYLSQQKKRKKKKSMALK
jgi:hypothetical protein